MLLAVVPLLGHHTLCGGLLEIATTTIVIVGRRLRLNNNEFLPLSREFTKVGRGSSLCIRMLEPLAIDPPGVLHLRVFDLRWDC